MNKLRSVIGGFMCLGLVFALCNGAISFHGRITKAQVIMLKSGLQMVTLRWQWRLC